MKFFCSFPFQNYLIVAWWIGAGSLVSGFQFPGEWQKVGPQPFEAMVVDAHFANRLWVAVGNEGHISTSPDGLVWELNDKVTSINLNAVTFGNGHWLAAGPKTILLSSDGLHWKTHSNEFDFHSITFGQDTWVAVEDQRILTSSDAISWRSSEIPDPNEEPLHLSKVLFTGNGFVAAGVIGDFWNKFQVVILHSDDAVNWRIAKMGTLRMESGALDADFGDGHLVVVAGGGDGRFSAPIYETWTSADGLNWEAANVARFSRVRHGHDGWLATSYHGGSAFGGGPSVQVWHSTDGKFWTSSHTMSGTCNLQNLRSGTDYWLEIRTHTDFSGPTRRTFTSFGQAPEIPSVGTGCGDTVWNHIWFEGRRWLTATHNHIITSSDAYTWKSAIVDVEFDFSPIQLAFNGEMWLMSCLNTDTGEPIFLGSHDGLFWTLKSVFTKPDGLPDRFNPLSPRSLIAADGAFYLYSSRLRGFGQPDGTTIISGQASVS